MERSRSIIPAHEGWYIVTGAVVDESGQYALELEPIIAWAVAIGGLATDQANPITVLSDLNVSAHDEFGGIIVQPGDRFMDCAMCERVSAHEAAERIARREYIK